MQSGKRSAKNPKNPPKRSKALGCSFSAYLKNSAEFQVIVRAAREAGLRPSAWARLVLLRAAARER